jgi:threonine/homoserine/homoserine lactone efflux protein
LPSRLHKWLRRWLWAWATTLAVIVALAWILGSWSTASNVVHSVILVGVGGYLAWLIVTGWIEWRQQRRKRNASD